MATIQALRAETPLHRWNPDDIGGGRVVRPFRIENKTVKAGEILTGDFIRALPPTNRHLLIANYISVWPKSPDAGFASTAGGETERAERHVVALGFGRFKVFEGFWLTENLVTSAEAYALAGKPEPQRRAGKKD
jgi:hypothetical protein